MAETDISHEFGGEPGFSCSVFGPERSHMLHKLLVQKFICKMANELRSIRTNVKTLSYFV